jgi:hypothetical protein
VPIWLFSRVPSLLDDGDDETNRETFADANARW